MDIPIEVIGAVLTLVAAGAGVIGGRVTKKPSIYEPPEPVPTPAPKPVTNRRYRLAAKDEMNGHPRRIYVSPDDESDRLVLED